MTTRTPDPMPEPTPEDMAAALAELENMANAAPGPEVLDNLSVPEDSGETRRVRKLRAQVAEARLLADLELDETPLTIDTDKVRKRRQAANEAARLYELAQAPAMQIYQIVRVRRLLVVTAMVSLTLALAWSTAGVQKFAADGAAPGSPGWLFAWLVEPFMSLALLVVVGSRAYLGTRGRVLDHPTVTRIERLFLALTATMNAWPYLPVIADPFSVSSLVLHLLGPVVAVAIVTVLPIILAAFAGLEHAPAGTPTGPSYRPNTAALDALTGRARRLIATGQLPADPGADKIRRALGCGMDTARAVRDALRADPA